LFRLRTPAARGRAGDRAGGRPRAAPVARWRGRAGLWPSVGGDGLGRRGGRYRLGGETSRRIGGLARPNLGFL